MAKLFIYRASAGSGKTHTLVTRYIKWALKYPSAFRHILAVTFTNRATQEMKQRIIDSLYGLSVGSESHLFLELCASGWCPIALQARSKAVLSLIIHQYRDFSVVTIDSFFYKIIQTFARELGLKPNVTIEMDEAVALAARVTALMKQQEPLLQQWLASFSLSKLLAGKTWRVEEEIKQLGKTLFTESFKRYEKELLAVMKQPDVWPTLLEAINKQCDDFEKKMQNIGKLAVTIITQNQLRPTDFSYGLKGVIGYFYKIAAELDFTPTKRACIGREKRMSWHTKNGKDASEHCMHVTATLLYPLLSQALELYEQDGLDYKTALTMRRCIHSFGIVSSLLLHLEQYRSEHNVLFMSDISTLLYEVIQANDTPFFYEQVGNHYRHFLIDEFQDLSLFQWTNIKPLLRNSLAQGYSNLLVGDVKQSIYRWRGSDWKVLNHEVEKEFPESVRHTLTTNRRSKKAVVTFNNAFFSLASKRLTDALEESLAVSGQRNVIEMARPMLTHIRDVYKDVYQDLPKDPFPIAAGYVELSFFHTHGASSKGALGWMHMAQETLVKRLKQLQAAAIPAQDILLLVRNHKEAALLTHLSHTLCTPSTGIYYKIASDQADLLSKHIHISVLIYTLYYLRDEEDLIHKTAALVAYAHYLKQDLATTAYHGSTHAHMHANMEQTFPASFWIEKDYLKQLSIYPSVALLIEILFGAPQTEREALCFFQSIVFDFCQRSTESPSIASFLSWWEQRGKRLKLPIASNDNSIKVMTIHQAKGLEFDTVILPFCNWNLDHMAHNRVMLWHKQQKGSSLKDFPVWPIYYGANLKETAYAEGYYLEYMQVHLDNLNLLYVAFTRAKARLYVMAPLPIKEGAIATTSDLIYQICASQSIEEQHAFQMPFKQEVGAYYTKFSAGSCS